ncbi:FBP domain-containing protein [Compostimonas suwonensis]|uniref:Treble-clef zinc-finger protein n=1 Tax=Compostimonas suwonensis TaxID=1048394 RepID=A0A2M9BYJ5_9MICO|nr:FBP domain-containing protein [Compostimonas suwonensis]PJJ63161.1 treble-clef zinc-finger protein [Compostimonas suwonensis]
MRPLSEAEVRSAIGNASLSELQRMSLPEEFDFLDWESLDFLGWRDRKDPLRAFLVVAGPGEPKGVILRAATSRMSSRIAASCMLCRSTQPADQVTLFSARRGGDAGRRGDSVGSYICDDLGCCALVRVAPSRSELHPEPALVVAERIAGLRHRAIRFVDGVLEV